MDTSGPLRTASTGVAPTATSTAASTSTDVVSLQAITQSTVATTPNPFASEAGMAKRSPQSTPWLRLTTIVSSINTIVTACAMAIAQRGEAIATITADDRCTSRSQGISMAVDASRDAKTIFSSSVLICSYAKPISMGETISVTT